LLRSFSLTNETSSFSIHLSHHVGLWAGWGPSTSLTSSRDATFMRLAFAIVLAVVIMVSWSVLIINTLNHITGTPSEASPMTKQGFKHAFVGFSVSNRVFTSTTTTTETTTPAPAESFFDKLLDVLQPAPELTSAPASQTVDPNAANSTDASVVGVDNPAVAAVASLDNEG
jgi:hypothetical protein